MQSPIMSVSSPQVQDELREFRNRVATCYGPFGRVALLQPIPEGHVTITNQSSQIFQLFKTSNLVLQVLLTSLQSHINNYYKGGKMAAILTTNVILNCLDLECPRRQISDVIDHLLTKALSYIQSKCCIELDWSSVTCLMNVVKTLLSSHPLCTLGKDELNHTTSLILQSFLHVIPTTPSLSSQLSVHDRIHIYLFSECSLPVSTLFKGLLLEEQHASCVNRDIELCLSDHCFKHNSQGLIITAVYDISLAGDQEDGYTNVIVMESSNVSTNVLQEEASCDQLLTLGAALIKRNIGLVICQKCVHPRLRKLLEKEGIVVLERLGLTYIDAVIDMTGGHVISSLTSPDQLGALTNVAMVTIGSKKYIHLEGIIPHASLTLPYLLKIVGDELKSLVISTIRCLEDLLYNPQVVNGGGCMFTKLAHYISSQQASDIVSHELHCNQRTFGEVCIAVSTSFHQTAAALQYNTNCLTLTDTATYHCWVFPSYDVCLSLSSISFGQSKSCVCGSVKLSDLPNDSSWVSVSGWKGQEPVIPDIVEDVLKANSSQYSHPFISFPVLCDPLRQTLSSISLSKQLAVMITRTVGVLLNED